MGVVRLGKSLVNDILPRLVLANRPVEGAPVWESAEVAVVDGHIGLQFPGEMRVVVRCLFGVVAVHGVELQAEVAAPLNCRVEQLALADRPQDQLVAVVAEHFQGINGERDFPKMGFGCADEDFAGNHNRLHFPAIPAGIDLGLFETRNIDLVALFKRFADGAFPGGPAFGYVPL